MNNANVPTTSAGTEPSEIAGAPTLSIVVPVYNEEDVILEFHKRISKVLDEIGASAEILYVNDGSEDRSLAMLYELNEKDLRVSVINLSRNFGKEIALTAGLDYSRVRPWSSLMQICRILPN